MARITKSLHVQGMSCSHCVHAIETALKDLAGVESVSVDLRENKVTVSFDEESVGLDRVKEAIEEAGYEVVG
ncbi:copper chaperone CopZ [Bacillaceae bacterium]